MKAIRFIAKTRKIPGRAFALSTEGSIRFGKTENPSRTEIINHLKQAVAEEFTTDKHRFTADDIIVKLSA